MNIYQKIQSVKIKLMGENIKKSGHNKFSNFKYYELSDFEPKITELCSELGLLIKFNFTSTEGILTIINTEKPDEKTEYAVPMAKPELKGCNEVQILGGSMTYLKRYLYMNAFSITEHDQFDCQDLRTKKEEEYKCIECGKPFEETVYKGIVFTPEQQYKKTINMHGKPICLECREIML